MAAINMNGAREPKKRWKLMIRLEWPRANRILSKINAAKAFRI